MALTADRKRRLAGRRRTSATRGAAKVLGTSPVNRNTSGVTQAGISVFGEEWPSGGRQAAEAANVARNHDPRPAPRGGLARPARRIRRRRRWPGLRGGPGETAEPKAFRADMGFGWHTGPDPHRIQRRTRATAGGASGERKPPVGFVHPVECLSGTGEPAQGPARSRPRLTATARRALTVRPSRRVNVRGCRRSDSSTLRHRQAHVGRGHPERRGGPRGPRPGS